MKLSARKFEHLEKNSRFACNNLSKVGTWNFTRDICDRFPFDEVEMLSFYCTWVWISCNSFWMYFSFHFYRVSHFSVIRPLHLNTWSKDHIKREPCCFSWNVFVALFYFFLDTKSFSLKFYMSNVQLLSFSHWIE